MKKVQIVVCRHPEKDGDKITAFGAMQAFAMAEMLKQRFGDFDRLIYSGAHRTWQAACIAAVALGVDPTLELRKEFHSNGPFKEVFGNDREAFFTEAEAIKSQGGTLEVALKLSKYARIGRLTLATALIKLAQEMLIKGSQTRALVLSHTPYAELAAVDSATMPYSIDECDGVLYTIEDGKIVSSELIKAPIKRRPLPDHLFI